MGTISSILGMLMFNPSIGAIYKDKVGGISFSSAFLQTFIAISSGISISYINKLKPILILVIQCNE